LDLAGYPGRGGFAASCQGQNGGEGENPAADHLFPMILVISPHTGFHPFFSSGLANIPASDKPS
jgi:hypothetical protein